jgi:GNAT superfamily N-acetyltransferase
MRAHEFVAEGARNNLPTIIQSFVNSPIGQKYKQHDCKTVTRAFVRWAEQNKIPTQVVLLAPPSADFIAKNPQFQSKKGKPGKGDGHIMPIVNGEAIDFTVRQFGVERPFENPLVTLIDNLPAVYGKFGYFTDNPDWFAGGKSQWIGALNAIPPAIFNQNFGDEILEHTMAETINSAILNKRFRHKQVIGDYTYKASVEMFMGEPLLSIKAYDGDREIGHILFEIIVRSPGGKRDPSADYIESGGTEVDPAYRNKGVASTMYAYAKMLGNDVRPSYNQTSQGQAMWAAWNKAGDAKHLIGTAAESTMAENFADGKIKGKSRPGRVKRAGASCDGSVTDLRARAKNASGEKAKMYHWCANMKSGRK